MKHPITNVATNLITGFLGVGKTTAILSLLHSKPEHERWAVLVNEAGKTGIDGSVIDQHGVVTRQIPGGCMCCASGAPLQAAVTRLLRDARPQRLLIEPSGIGHPRQILRMLAQPAYQGVLQLRATLCLIDPRVLNERRYTSHPIFKDQVAVADLLVANKIDLCTPQQLGWFDEFVRQHAHPAQTIERVSHGRIPGAWLERPQVHPVDNTEGLPAGHTFYTDSRNFPQDTVFDHSRLTAWIEQLNPERLKAIVKTNLGTRFINYTRGTLQSSPISATKTNRIEIISTTRTRQTDWLTADRAISPQHAV